MPSVDNGDGTFKTEGTDFHNEKQVKAMLARGALGKIKWIDCGNKYLGIKMNWIVFVLATFITWGFAFWSMFDEEAGTKFGGAKTWVSQNFTWLYIITQDLWCLFLIYLMFSRFGDLKLGQPNEKPKYNDFTWFCMLFTCGVAVGLYVFGVNEPMYFYRQPTSWGDYSMAKSPIDNDANRAQMAIFMAVYHWGIHGWVPYILLALLIGIVSFRWGMPMTIRSCFYPLIGDHALGPIGDFIDALSIATTTFGVCTSLGLGVGQIASGLQFLANINCSAEKNCVAAGGTWDITGYGADNCNAPTSTPATCTTAFLADEHTTRHAQIMIIMLISIAASISVISGLDRGIQLLSKIAMTLGLIVMFTIMFADNTWYLLNLMVQTTGYYIQWVIQVGFDCEAFAMLNIEFNTAPSDGGYNKLWGSNYETSVYGTLEAVQLNPSAVTTTKDCGDLPNPCAQGIINVGLAATMVAGSIAGGQAETLLKHFHVSPNGISKIKAAKTTLDSLYSAGGGALGIPCGSGWATDNFDAFTSANVAAGTIGNGLCAGLTGAQLISCTNLWTPSGFGVDTSAFPRCPETTVTDQALWGVCHSHSYTCTTTSSYYDDTYPQFMDWWTIFYWAWWITWAPFVGFFVALISRGRTVREVIIGGFVCPTLFAILWFSVLGGLAIKMQRVAEVALQVRPDTAHAMTTCGEHYSGWTPITPESKKLAEAGYYMLSCTPGSSDNIYLLMAPYKNLTSFLHIILWFGLVIFFLTSSDSGSMTDDIISASGLSAPRIPIWQKVFWCWTEGVVAISLLINGNALSTLRALSIVIGLPFTILLCHMVPSTYRALKREMGDEDIMHSNRFNTQLLDLFEGFKPHTGTPFGCGEYLTNIVIAVFFPCVGFYKTYKHCFPNETLMPIFWATLQQLLFLLFIVLHAAEEAANRDGAIAAALGGDWRGFLDAFTGKGLHTLAWVSYCIFTFINTYLRGEMRSKYKIWGNYVEDFWSCLVFYPVAIAQFTMHATSEGKDMKKYFHSLDSLIQEMADAAEDGNVIPASIQQPVTVTSKPSQETAFA